MNWVQDSALTHVLGPWCGVHRTPSCDNDQQSIPSRSPHRLATTSDFFSGLHCRSVRPPLRDPLHLLWARTSLRRNYQESTNPGRESKELSNTVTVFFYPGTSNHAQINLLFTPRVGFI
ncbi:hypothetical protein evm_013541 [Chilo suppressalis]|nr:hypothetical protein evm_013541 [Chilo suppressalis]